MTFISDRRLFLLLLFLLASVVPLVFHSVSISQEMPKDSKEVVPVAFSADKVTTNLNKKLVILTGNAVIEQEDKKISADSIEIDFSDSDLAKTPSKTDTATQKGNDTQKEAETAKQIKTVTATGKVNISMGQRQALTEKAVYTSADGKIVLTGKDSTVTGPEGKLVCSKIIIDRNSSVSECLGSGKSRASGLIFSDKSGF